MPGTLLGIPREPTRAESGGIYGAIKHYLANRRAFWNIRNQSVLPCQAFGQKVVRESEAHPAEFGIDQIPKAGCAYGFPALRELGFFYSLNVRDKPRYAT